MKNISTEVFEKLESFYSKESFFNGLLHKTCKNAKECWKKRSDNVKKESKWNYFSLPYIGKEYKGELVCVGLNVHEGGGRNLQEMQIRGINVFKSDKEPHKNDINGDKYDPGVIESLEKGIKRINFKNGMKKMGVPYGGTPLWHRIAVYSKIFLDGYYPNVANPSKELAKIYERIIYMDAIKCSPANIKSEKAERSSPTPEMVKLCPEYIFFKELEIIKPDNILIMSKPVAERIKIAYTPIKSSENFPCSGKDFDFCQIKIGGKSVNVYYIIHPCTRPTRTCGGGNRIELFEKFADFVKSKK